MSVSYYDKALTEKIQKWIKGDTLKVMGPDQSLRLFQTISDIKKDKAITLPFISLSRAPNVEISSDHKKPMSFDGLMIAHPEFPPELKTDSEKQQWLSELREKQKAKSLQVNAIPMVLNYQLDIYTKTLKQADEYIRNFVFNFINHPKLTVELPYNNVNYKHDCNVRIVSPVQDNSDIPSRLFPGQFYRWTISLIIDDAYLFSVPFENLVDIEDYEVELDESVEDNNN